jgi:hypothetical protein
MSAFRRRSLLASPALIAALGASDAEAQTAQPLRIAMSIGDVPRLWGGPEAGFEVPVRRAGGLTEISRHWPPAAPA